jgi:hypothetical protein
LIPLAPLALVFGVLDLLAAFSTYLGKDWGFQLMVILGVLSFAEMWIAWSTPVFLTGIWIVMLWTMCLPKDAFYAKLFQSRIAPQRVTVSLPDPRGNQ